MEKDADCVRFIVPDTGLIDECGFAYYPNNPPAASLSSYHPVLSDGWIVWEN